MNSYRHGLVIGKFYPPHLGHHHLIDAAATQCDILTVLVQAAQTETIPLSERVAWLRSVHAGSNVSVRGSRCDIPMDLYSETVWAAQTAVIAAGARHSSRQVGSPVDVLFSSEAYGDELADRLGVPHVPVDPGRGRFPVSGTGVRSGLTGSWDLLHPVVRAGLTTRVVVLGAESTGTTTISRALAAAYRARGGVWERTGWVPEYGREHTHLLLSALEPKTSTREMADLVWTAPDFTTIARTQDDLENAAAMRGSPVLVCDTDSFATTVWERRYLGSVDGSAYARTSPRTRTVYLVTDHQGVPFVQDGLRDGEHIRAEMTGWFVDALTEAGHSWALLTGTVDQRLDLATRIVDETLAYAATFNDPVGHVPTVLAATPPRSCPATDGAAAQGARPGTMVRVNNPAAPTQERT